MRAHVSLAPRVQPQVFFSLNKVLTFHSVDDNVKYDHSNESYRAVLSYGAVHDAVQDESNVCFCGANPKAVRSYSGSFH